MPEPISPSNLNPLTPTERETLGVLVVGVNEVLRSMGGAGRTYVEAVLIDGWQIPANVLRELRRTYVECGWPAVDFTLHNRPEGAALALAFYVTDPRVRALKSLDWDVRTEGAADPLPQIGGAGRPVGFRRDSEGVLVAHFADGGGDDAAEKKMGD